MAAPDAPQPGTIPPKKRRKWPWIVGGVVAVLIAVAALSDGGSDSDKSNAAGQHGTTDAGLNTPVRDGKFEFVVTNVQDNVPQVGDNPYSIQKAQGKYVIVSMTIKNIGDESQSFSPSSQKLFDADNRSFESDTMAQIALGNSDIPVWDNINPGNQVDAKVIYDMPPGAVPTAIELHDSMFSGGAKVSLTAPASPEPAEAPKEPVGAPGR